MENNITMNDTECRWPESEVIDEWVKKNNIDVPINELFILKTEVTKERIKIQEELYFLKQKNYKEKLKNMKWWKKDRFGYPIVFYKNRKIFNAIRIIILNFKKLL